MNTTIKQLKLFDVPVEQKEYLLIISPSESVKKKIYDIKKDFGVKFKSNHALHSLAHISILGKRLKEEHENSFMKRIETVCKDYRPFEIKLNGFNGFPSHTIYTEVTKNDYLQHLHYDLLESLSLSSRMTFTPHLTIARQLKPNQFEAALPEYLSKSFHQSFVTESLLLMKREGEFTRYQKVTEFRFGR
ncbi:MAG: 2'-5' RNA ligase family protein [Bacteroidia bacterium]